MHEAPAVKELGGTLMKPLVTLAVKCLPKDLVNTIDVDLSTLHTFDDVIRVSDLVLPPGITALEESDTTIAKVAPPLTEEEIKAMDEATAPSVADIEISVEKGKKEEAPEGEEAAAEEKK
jgi:large subunit ribosomal protein L25